jgi:crotonobetainyl-CoA:carnitine CoA-transferase CaiB-like acyl-CoA transferase
MGADLLDGIRVLDFTLAAVGPFCTRVLCDLGAEVIHVEWPRVRWAAARSGWEDSRFIPENVRGGQRPDQLFLHTNGGKKSLAVNLKKPAGVEFILSLISGVDVVVENMTPRVMVNFGLDYEALSERNPGLIMCSLSGFGRHGYEGDITRPCADPVAQAMSGISFMTGERDGPPYAVGGGLGDTATSITGTTAILAALVGRARTGTGQYIDLSMVESLAYMDCTVLPGVAMSGQGQLYRNGQQNSYTFPMGPFKVTGGYVAIQASGAGPDSPWGRLCYLMDREEMITDERLIDDAHRLQHVTEVIQAVEDWLCSLPDREAALTLLASERISAGPVLSQEEMLVHPFFAERGMFGTVHYPELGPVTVVEPPFKFSDAAAFVRGPAPEMGEHTREIALSYAGLDEEQIEELIASEVLYESSGARRRNGVHDPA